jgi:hypothetical protein
MRHLSLSLFLLTAFAVTMGCFAYRTWNPSPAPEYTVGGLVRPMSLPGGQLPKKHLYLRRTLYLTQPVERAWLQVLGHDYVEVFVNGRRAARTPRVSQGRIGGAITDISPLLHAGRNSVALHAVQLSLGRPPKVAITGECEFADGSRMWLGDPETWLASNVYDRRGEYWYETEFQDDHWEEPVIGAEELWYAQVNVPPRALSESRQSRWITPAKVTGGAAAIGRSFELPGTPSSGWLRVVANGPYCLAINGWQVRNDHADVAKTPVRQPVEQTLDISAVLRSGTNTVAFSITTAGESPRLRADLEATTTGGQRVYVATDGDWKSATGSPADWLSPDFAADSWQPCHVEAGYLGVVPRGMKREIEELDPPSVYWVVQALHCAGWIALFGVLAACGAYSVDWIMRRVNPQGTGFPAALPYLALLPSSVAAASAGLLTWDLAWTGHDVFQPRWTLALALLVIMQWLVMIILSTGRQAAVAARLRSPQLPDVDYVRRTILVSGWLLLVGLALWLRVRDIVAEPIHHDEVSVYMFSQSILEYGFPGGQPAPDLPFGFVATNELTYYPTALCALFVDDPRLAVRIPSVVWSMGTLLLLAYVGWRWFNPAVGFVAGVLYALSPHAIYMANFGRYLAQTQFFTLLTMYLTYEAVRGTGRPRRWHLWGAAASFAAMYLSWEGAGMFGVGLALGVLLYRRRHLPPVLACPSLYAASIVVLLIVVGQNAHRILQQTQRLWYGEGISSLTITPMWRFPFFDPTYYLLNASWTRDALLPTLALGAACLVAVTHRWRFPLRFSLICLVSNAMLMSTLLPLRTNRYSYHLSEILILIAAAVAVAGAEAILKLVPRERRSTALGWYARAVCVSCLAVGIVLASGWPVRTSELGPFVTSASDVRQLRIPDWDGPTEYLFDHWTKGDVLISIFPHIQNFAISLQPHDRPLPQDVDYWLESRLIVQATVGDSADVPLDRRSGSVMLYDVEQLEQLFAQHDRIWYCTLRYGHSRINDSTVSKYLRDNMDVVYEDFGTSLMLRDTHHHPARLRLEGGDAERVASELYLK